MKKNHSITIVTAFFDIGRGGWTADKGFSSHLERDNNNYFDNFKRLASLENKMIVYTSADLAERVLSLRQGRQTKVIAVDLKKKFPGTLRRIEEVQKSPSFIMRIGAEALKNPEYWSPEYVLATNLKTYFVQRSIISGFVDDMVAWIDFGYFRQDSFLMDVKNWSYNFNQEKFHIFSIKPPKTISLGEKEIERSILNNRPPLAGGALLAHKKIWPKFFRMVIGNQENLLNRNIVDDDQGVFLMAYATNKEMFQVNYLGRGQWLDLFRRFGGTRRSRIFNIFNYPIW